jgi:hypothetical protein
MTLLTRVLKYPGQARLFPGPPVWAEDADAFFAFAKERSAQIAMMSGYLPAAADGRERARRARLLTALYAGAEATRLSVAQHTARFARAGYALSPNAAVRPVDTMDWARLMGTSTHRVDAALRVDPTLPAPARTCSRCRDAVGACPPECLCGAAYCSGACHDADWPAHRAACDLAQQACVLANVLTEYSWRAVATKEYRAPAWGALP